MCQPNEGGSMDEEMTKLFFDLDGASSGDNRMPMTGLNSTSHEEMGYRSSSTDPATTLPSSNTIVKCYDTMTERPEGFNLTYLTSSAPIPMTHPSNRHCEDTKQVFRHEPGPAQLAPQPESEAGIPYEFVALREIELSQEDIHPSSTGALQGSINTCQPQVSLEQVNPFLFRSHIMDTQVTANPSVLSIETHMVSRPLEAERPKDMISDQRKRKRSPPRGGFLLPDLLGCSPWPRHRRTEQDRTERDEVIKAGGSCLLCKFRHKKCSGKRPCQECYLFWGKRSLRTTSPQWTCDVYDKFSELEFLNFHLDSNMARQDVSSYISQHHSITAKIFEFIKCHDPIRGVEYEIIRAYLPEKITTLFLTCFLPLRAFRCKDALVYFDPDLEQFLADVEQSFRQLIREIFKQCDNLFAAKHRDVAVGLLGALHHELDCMSAIQGVTSDGVKHVKGMVVSRLKILCPLLVDVRERQRSGSLTMKASSAAIVRLDEELTPFLSPADLMLVHQIVQIWHDWQQDSLHQKLESRINGKTQPCRGIHVSSVPLEGGIEAPLQAACYCQYVWESIEGDISSFFQITRESLSSLLHQNLETVIPIMRKNNNQIKFEKLGEILGGVFGQVKQENDTHLSLYKVTIFLRAIKFVPEFIFKTLPGLYEIATVSLDEIQRVRQASTYRHLVLLSLLVQACTLVDDFIQEIAVNPPLSAIRPFESYFFRRRESDVFDTFNEALVSLYSIHQSVLERETGMALPELYTPKFDNS